MTAPEQGTLDDVLAALAHDVAKYLTRTARNVPPGAALPPSLVPMLVKDLYETHRGRRASSRLAELVAALPAALAAEDAVVSSAAHLARIDALEAAVRRGDASAVEEALSTARAVGAMLHAFALAHRRADEAGR